MHCPALRHKAGHFKLTHYPAARKLCHRVPGGVGRCRVDACFSSRMVGWSVAVGRFFEALFWAMLQAAGQIALGAVVGLAVLILGWRLALGRWPWVRR